MSKTVLPTLAAFLAVLAGCGGEDAADTTGSPPPSVDAAATTAGDGSAVLAAPIPGGGLSVTEALGSGLTEPLLVRGYVVVAGGQASLCESLRESSPPQCGEPSLQLAGFDAAALPVDLEGDGAVSWSNDLVSLIGPVQDGVLTIDPTLQA